MTTDERRRACCENTEPRSLARSLWLADIEALDVELRRVDRMRAGLVSDQLLANAKVPT